MILTKEQAFFCARMIKNAIENNICWLRMEIGRSDEGRRQINFAYTYDTTTQEEAVIMDTYNPFTSTHQIEREKYKSVSEFERVYEVVPQTF